MNSSKNRAKLSSFGSSLKLFVMPIGMKFLGAVTFWLPLISFDQKDMLLNMFAICLFVEVCGVLCIYICVCVCWFMKMKNICYIFAHR